MNKILNIEHEYYDIVIRYILPFETLNYTRFRRNK